MIAQKGIAPFFIVIIAAALLVTGVGGYIVVSKKKISLPALKQEQVPAPEEKQQKESPPVSTESPKIALDALQGIWTAEDFFEFNPQKKQFLPTQGDKNSYVAFKGNKICINGKLDAKRMPLPCVRYGNVTVEGALLMVSDTDQKLPPLEWSIVGDVLTFIFEISDSQHISKKVKVVFRRLSGVAPSSPVTDSVKPEKQQSREQSPILEIDISKLIGVWRVVSVFVVNQKGEFREAALPFSLYTEFRPGTICRSWEMKDGAGQCKEYHPILIHGNTIDVRDPSSPTKFQWNITGGKLELIEIDVVTNTPKTKTISEKAGKVEFSMPVPKAPTPSAVPLDQKLLIGLWKLEKVFGYDPRDDTWKENSTPAAPYQEFTAKTFCSSSTTMSGDEPEPARFKCLSMTPYTVSKDIISFELPGLSGGKETAYYRGHIVDITLELGVGISDQPFLKYIYKNARVSWPGESFTIQLEDTNPPQKNKPFKVRGERKTTETINMWLTDRAGNILSAEIASFWCSTLGAQSDICMAEVTGERADYDPRPDNPQCPFPEIPFGSHPKIGQAICFVPQLDGQFQIELLIKNPGTYMLHAKATQSGIEAVLPIIIN